jgi:hypothetical protein
LFPAWTNNIPAAALTGLVLLGGLVTFVVWYYFSPKHTDVGYQPVQPVPYSHKLHAGEMGMDCRYCHTGVEKSAHATVPPTQTCMNCHNVVRKDSPKLAPVRDSWATNMPVEWKKVHKIPDYAYFDHSRHVNRGVGCVECHGRIDQMEVVRQVQPLSMSWCLDCHRNPAPHLRPKDVSVTQMDWKAPEDPQAFGEKLVQEYNIQPPQDCSGCHR